jgi:hypothetical protein
LPLSLKIQLSSNGAGSAPLPVNISTDCDRLENSYELKPLAVSFTTAVKSDSTLVADKTNWPRRGYEAFVKVNALGVAFTVAELLDANVTATETSSLGADESTKLNT